MPAKEDRFGIFWQPESHTLLIHEDFYEFVEPLFRVIKLVSDITVVIPPPLRAELQTLVTSVINECGVIALAWVSWVLSVLWWLTPDVTDFGVFTVEKTEFIFDHAFGSDTSHRVRIDT